VSGDFHEPADAPHTTIVEQMAADARNHRHEGARSNGCSTSNRLMPSPSKSRPSASGTQTQANDDQADETNPANDSDRARTSKIR
jgi:hypothetical protein